MPVTISGYPPDPAQPATISGLRFLRRARYFPDTADPYRPITIGRSRTHDIVIAQHTVSRLHCELLRTIDGRMMIRDCDSRNGIYAPNGLGLSFKRVNWHLLQLGSPIYVGEVLIVPVDEHGKCPIVAATYSEFIRNAGRLYNSIRAVNRLARVPWGIAKKFLINTREEAKQ